MQSFKNQIKAFFNFNKSQERGAFVLIVLIALAAAVNYFLPHIYRSDSYDYSAALAEIEEWQASAVERKASYSTPNKEESKKDVELVQLNPFPFNPNKLPKTKWLEMGMPESVVNTILNYEAKGGFFGKKEDIQKIYGLNEDLYNQIKDFISIPKITDSVKKESLSLDQKKPIRLKKLDINRVDSIALLNVPGIGPFYAGQIVKYRNRLGGYTGLEQLGELYKMDSIRLHAILPYLSFSDSACHQINLNSAEFKEVLKHPYLDYETTKKIFDHRNKLGRFAGLYELKKDSILSDSLFQKILPYLKVDE